MINISNHYLARIKLLDKSILIKKIICGLYSNITMSWNLNHKYLSQKKVKEDTDYSGVKRTLDFMETSQENVTLGLHGKPHWELSF